MYKHYTFTYILLALISSLQAQKSRIEPVTPPDSATKAYYLSDVTILGHNEPLEKQLLHFYKAQPLGSTEDILSRLPGISLIRRGNYAQEPILRGLNTNQVNITIDGMRMFEACTDKMDPVTAYVEPNNLEAVEVQAGPQGMEFGSTSAGSINLRLKKPQYADSVQLHGRVGARWQSMAAGISQNASADYRSPRLGLRANMTYRKSGNYRAGGGEAIRYSGFEKLNYSLSGMYKLSGKREMAFDFLGDNAWNIGYAALPMDVAYAHAYMGSFTYRQKVNSPHLLRWKIKAYANRVDHAMDDTNRDSVAMHMDMPGYTRTAGAFWEGDVMLGTKHFIQVKADGYTNLSYAEMTMYPKGETPMFMLTWPEVQRRAVGLVISDRYQWKSRWQLRANMRLERGQTAIQSELGKAQLEIFFPQYEGNTTQLLLNGTLGVRGKLTRNIEVEGRAAYGERMPSISEQFGYYLFSRYDGYDYLGNPFLNKEQSWQTEASTTLKYRTFQVRLTGFSYFFNQYIQAKVEEAYLPMTIGAQGVKIYENLPSASLLGAEMQLVWRPLKQWQATSVLKYSYGRDHEDTPLPLIPPLEVQGALRYQTQNASLQVEAVWNAPQKRINSDFGEMPSEEYLIMNARGIRRFSCLGNEIAISLGVENVFDARYAHHLDWGDIPRPGRNVYVNLGYRFW